MKFISNRIRTAREELGISQKKLGMILGLSDKAISAYEAGRTYPPLDTLFKLADELKKPVTYFIEQDATNASILNSLVNIEEKIKSIENEFKSIKEKLINRS